VDGADSEFWALFASAEGRWWTHLFQDIACSARCEAIDLSQESTIRDVSKVFLSLGFSKKTPKKLFRKYKPERRPRKAAHSLKHHRIVKAPVKFAN